MSFAVYIARQSGERIRPSTTEKGDRARILSNLEALLVSEIDEARPGLQLAQLSLVRCFYLQSELTAIEKKAPEATMALARMCVETALIGSYLALSNESDLADRMMKGLGTYARRLQRRFKEGRPLSGLDLLPDIPLISNAIAPRLQDVVKSHDLFSICRELDKHLPFSEGNLATLLYEETYTVLSNHVVHPTVLTLSRHSGGGALAPFVPAASPLVRRAAMIAGLRPSPLDARGASWSATAATVALSAAFARGIGQPSEEWDRGAQEIRGIDGYWWSGSPARMIGARELARMADLPALSALNTAGFMVRVAAVSDPFQGLSPNEQFVCASEIFDLVRTWWQKMTFLRVAAPHALPNGGTQTPQICTGAAGDSTQASLAALALVYAGAWPDDPDQVRARIEEFDLSAPHRQGVYSELRDSYPHLLDSRPSDVRSSWRRSLTRMKEHHRRLP